MANEIVPVQQYAVMTMDQNDLQEVLQENLGGGNISVNDLDRIKFPSGGSVFWTVPTLEGEDAKKEIEGVIIYQKDSRVYFDKPFSESNGEAPVCYSDDAQTGMMLVNSETGERHKCECATCPFAQWGSGKDGKGQACNLNKNLFLITQESLLPVHVRVPAGSYAIARKYLISLTGKAKPYYAVLSKLGLKKVQNANNIDYAELVIGSAKVLAPEELQRFKAMHEQFKPLLSQVRSEFLDQKPTDVTPQGDSEESGPFAGGHTIDISGDENDL